MPATRKDLATGRDNDRSAEGRSSERRKRRSECLADALRLQLDACRDAEGVTAIVVSDEIGFCVAHSGGEGTHDQLAASLPMLADPSHRPGDNVDGMLPPSDSLVITSFSAGEATLYACAVGGPGAAKPDGGGGGRDGDRDGVSRQALERVARGFARLLAQ